MNKIEFEILSSRSLNFKISISNLKYFLSKKNSEKFEKNFSKKNFFLKKNGFRYIKISSFIIVNIIF